MKKSNFTLVMALAFASMQMSALEQVDGVYQIGTADELVEFANLVNGGENGANATLTDDIDMEGVEFPMIGTATVAYKGTFDGAYHTISNMVINKPDEDYVAMFRMVNGDANVNQIVMDESCSFTGKNYVAALIAADPADGGGFYFAKRNIVSATVKGQNNVGVILGSCQGTGNGTQILNCEINKAPEVLHGATDEVRAGAVLGFCHLTVVQGALIKVPDMKWCGGLGAPWACDYQGNNYTVATAETDGDFHQFTDEQRTSGELCWRLNNNDGKNYWCQIVDIEGVDAQAWPTLMPENREYIVFANGKYRCDGAVLEGETYTYSNTDKRELSSHSYKDSGEGFSECEFCHDLDLGIDRDEEGVYLVSEPEQLLTIAKIVNSGKNTKISFEIPDVLDMQGIDYEPIGTRENPFRGQFGVKREHGVPALIKNLVINRPEQDYVGFIGVAASDQGACVMRGAVLDKSCSVTGKNYVGGILGYALSGWLFLSNVGNEGEVTALGDYAGGIIGATDNGGALELKHMYNTGKILADNVAGGISSRAWLVQLFDGGTYNAGEILTRNEATVESAPFNNNQEHFDNFNTLMGITAGVVKWEEGVAFNLGNDQTFTGGNKIKGIKAKEVSNGALANALNGGAPAYEAGETVDVHAEVKPAEGQYYYQNLPNDAEIAVDEHPVFWPEGHYLVARQGSGLRVNYFNVGVPESTGVTEIIPENEIKNHTYYNINGVRIERPTTPGVYIMDGKKVYIH